ncbi:MAG: hypothetical protein K2I18_08090 [Paramuribaculum sp.]|nr:hypothetical protein [Paramuribaculum sp.]
MMCKDSTQHWSAFGAVVILIVALSNSSCCSHQKVAERTREETVAHVTTSAKGCEVHTRHQEATLTRETRNRGTTVTEIEVFDTEKQPDPATGQRPLKAKIRQTHGEEHLSNETADFTDEDKTETATESVQTIDGGTLAEVTVTATKAPSLWERLKQGAAWAVAIMILTAAVWIIYKFKKRKTT